MVLALLLAAIIWNFGTWYMAIPASSSHTLIGAIIGVGLTSSWMAGHFGSGVNWKKAGEVGLSLFISPLIGFFLAALLLLLFKRLVRNPIIHEPPVGDKPPPPMMRGLLILTCTGVSFAHGSNDGQKGVGLIMLILIGLVPISYALNMDQTEAQFKAVANAPGEISRVLDDPEVRSKLASRKPVALASLRAPADTPKDAVTDLPTGYGVPDVDLSKTQELLGSLHNDLDGKSSPKELSPETRWQVRTKTLLVEQMLNKIVQKLSEEKAEILNQYRHDLRSSIEYAPMWVIGLVAVALGAGTIVGWKRIVVTVGEKIGKTHLTYSQGASAELVAMTTIGMADILGMPVSTTHVLSSGVAGTMAANKSGLQMSTIRSILLAWVLTLPASIFLAGGLFMLFSLFV